MQGVVEKRQSSDTSDTKLSFSCSKPCILGSGLRFMGHGSWFMVYGLWFMISDF